MTVAETTRRHVLAGAAAVGATALAGSLLGAAPAAAATATAEVTNRSLVGEDQALHLLRRATYGPTPQSIAELKALGVSAWLDRQLNPAAIADPACDGLLARLPLVGLDITRTRAQLAKNSYDGFKQLGRATVARAIWSNRQLLETVVEFWRNHLHVAAPSSGVWDSRCDYDRTVVRAHALGRFADMLKASARHPAMLTYLDNRSSTRSKPNENYARELLELHTVGLIYSEDDVKHGARLLSGMTVSSAGTYVYDTARHATGAVSILGFSHANAVADGESAALAYLDHLAMHPATARTIARKLVVRFVADEPPATLVDALAKVYLDNRTAIVPVLRALFTSSEFAASVGAKTRTPLEDLAATVRALGLGPEATGTAGLDALYNGLVNAGHAPMRWSPPNGFPDVAAAWASPSAFLLRCNSHLNLAAGWYPKQLTRPADLLKALVPVRPVTYGGLVDALAVRLIGVKLPPAQTAAVLSVTGKLPTSSLSSTDTAVAGHLPYLIALVLDAPAFSVR
ncbi:DUF1800 domain-containing protein [Spirilliplanes yamanashiensis]|uniref:DUF1800 domain-containing protein n=1 Tax=Spirilliplanes yamanashiensis TaxID=42233 RepID=A0A8J3YBA5_9ACTN|nr:DUF1800 domain-containing protein [Spirilliplanes yamanashiensis]MDP9817996.1 uncharacterized protein (DUF1800 family) [Spirilliplanes yamanashiensis]GIJ04805.1 hypothetical protein Sya03_41570 [Spirilliplanes yamanashiensis]